MRPATAFHASATATCDARASDHRDDLHFPVDHLARQGNVRGRSRDAARELGEGERGGRQRRAGLTGVVAVVETDAERLAGLGDRRTKRGAGDRTSGIGRRAPLVDRVQLGVPRDRDERVGERVVARERGEVVPGSVVLERGTTVDVYEAKHALTLQVVTARALRFG